MIYRRPSCANYICPLKAYCLKSQNLNEGWDGVKMNKIEEDKNTQREKLYGYTLYSLSQQFQ